MRAVSEGYPHIVQLLLGKEIEGTKKYARARTLGEDEMNDLIDDHE
jgi:hypothetical protein